VCLGVSFGGLVLVHIPCRGSKSSSRSGYACRKLPCAGAYLPSLSPIPPRILEGGGKRLKFLLFFLIIISVLNFRYIKNTVSITMTSVVSH